MGMQYIIQEKKKLGLGFLFCFIFRKKKIRNYSKLVELFVLGYDLDKLMSCRLFEGGFFLVRERESDEELVSEVGIEGE